MNEIDDEEDDMEAAETPPPPAGNYMTPEGFAALRDELQHLLRRERPKIVEIVSWAAGNGDRSENGDYLYNKKRLREIDRRVRYLTKVTEGATIVDPKQQQGLDRVFFGATVTYAGADDAEHTVKLVGIDEADLDHGKINWLSPLAQAIMKKSAGDEVKIRTANGMEILEVIRISYPLTS